jgi:hypothetical protein
MLELQTSNLQRIGEVTSASPENVFVQANWFALGFCILIPLGILLFMRVRTKFPLAMAGLLFVFGPLVGSFVVLLVGSLAKKDPDVIGSMVLWPVGFLLTLPFYGLWVVDCGILAWWWLGDIVRRMSIATTYKALLGCIFGGAGGLFINFGFLAVNSLNPIWPASNRFFSVLEDPVSLLSVALQGLVAGAVCGMIVVRYIDDALHSSGAASLESASISLRRSAGRGRSAS